MKLLYMKNDCFCSSPFLAEYQNRILDYCEQEEISHIFISGWMENKESGELFLEVCEDSGIEVILSPWTDKIEGIPGTMNLNSLFLYGVGRWKAHEGVSFYIDTDQHSSQPIYMDLFLKQVKYVDAENLEEELHELLHDILRSHKKSNQYH